MFFEKKTIFYALLGMLVIATLGFFIDSVLIFFIYNLLLFSIFTLDFTRTPRKETIKVTRQLDDKLSLGIDNKITIIVTNNSNTRVKIDVRDWYPYDFRISQKVLSCMADARSEKKLSYKVTPLKRGKYKFGNIAVRVHGILGLVGRQFKINGEKEIRVYPNIRDISSYLLLARRGRLTEVGLKRSRIYGMGTEFEYLKEYQPDDEYRKINWKATARRNRLITSQYEIERSQNIFIVIEAGRMMTSRVDGIAKFDYALNAALMLSYIAMDRGDNVGLMVFDEDVKAYLPPGKGKKQLRLIVEALYNQHPSLVEPDYGRAIRYLSLKNRKRSLVVFFTDLIDEDVSKAIVLYTRTLYPKHLPLCVAIADPKVEEETLGNTDTIREVYSKAVAEELLQQREQVKIALQKGGVLTLDTMPKNLTPFLISRYLEVKAKNRL
ncbi:MAG: DUF58 domain-containing protein [Vulcanimicrobiota bacterium]